VSRDDDIKMKFPAFSSKKEVAEFLARGYRVSDSCALANVNILKLTGDRLPYPDIQRLPFQPNIDVLWYEQSKDELNGVIVKYFRQPAEAVTQKTVKSVGKSLTCQLRPSRYYAGIGDALAILNYGVDYSWLFHVFDDNVSNQLAEFTYDSAAKLLSLTPIAYMVVVHAEAKMLTEKVSNPNLKYDEIKRLRKIIIESLLSKRNM
jgi:hypothetical protein